MYYWVIYIYVYIYIYFSPIAIYNNNTPSNNFNGGKWGNMMINGMRHARNPCWGLSPFQRESSMRKHIIFLICMDPSAFLASLWGMIWGVGLSTFSGGVWIHRECLNLMLVDNECPWSTSPCCWSNPWSSGIFPHKGQSHTWNWANLSKPAVPCFCV